MKHTCNPITDDDITEADHAIVQNFYDDACHAEWCEFDYELLLYVAVRSRLDGMASVQDAC